MSFLVFLWRALATFTVGYLEDYYKRGKSKYILTKLRKFDTLSAKLVSSTFDKRKMITYISFSTLTKL